MVTHDRWFLDAVCTLTWEVADQTVRVYEGGFAAWMLARAERLRVATEAESRRQNLLRKEIAWLRRGPPARTSKPKFRIDAANALIADVPPAARHGDAGQARHRPARPQVYDLDARHAQGRREAAARPTSPGTSARATGSPSWAPTAPASPRCCGCSPAYASRTAAPSYAGQTVRPAFLSQELTELPGDLRLLEAVEEVAKRVKLGDRELSAAQLAEVFGFTDRRVWTPVADLSGGERRRLQMLRLLAGEPNVLLLDEPTNDLDTDTLAALEDLLDTWPGTMVVASHDRYLVERVTEHVYAHVRRRPARPPARRRRRVPGPVGDRSGAPVPAAAYRRARRRGGAPDGPSRRPTCARPERRSPGWSARWRSTPSTANPARGDGRARHRLRPHHRARRGAARSRGRAGTSSKRPGSPRPKLVSDSLSRTPVRADAQESLLRSPDASDRRRTPCRTSRSTTRCGASTASWPRSPASTCWSSASWRSPRPRASRCSRQDHLAWALGLRSNLALRDHLDHRRRDDPGRRAARPQHRPLRLPVGRRRLHGRSAS